MKIISQTADEMALKEGDASALAIGVVFMLAGLGYGLYRYATLGWSSIVWIPIGVFVVGAIVLFSSSSIAMDVNKANGQIAYRKTRVIGGSSARYAIADVLQIETRKQWQMQQNNSRPGDRGLSVPQEVLVAQSVIVFKDGRQLPIDHPKSSSNASVGGVGVTMGNQIGKEDAIANQLATFMGVPFQEIMPPGGPMGINIGGAGIQL